MKPGYAFELNDHAGHGWRDSDHDDWDIVMVTGVHDAKRVGSRFIDGARCTVFRAFNGKFYAQTEGS